MRSLIVAIAMVCISGLTQAQRDEAFPTTQIKLIVPAAPGGNPDVLARVLAQKLAVSFGRPVIVENQAGAGGTLAAGTIARAADAHTIGVLDSSALTIAPLLSGAQGMKIPYDEVKDFTPITALASVPTLLVVHPSLPVTTLAEFIAYGKANPTKLNFGSAGVGGIHHLTMLAFVTRAGIEVTHVPYRGGALISAGLLGGEIHAGFNGIPNVLDHIATGKMRAIAASTLTRLKTHPSVPTIAESGFPGFDLAATMGLFVRSGTPVAIVERIQAAAAKAMREPDLVQRIEAIGMVIREDGTAHYEQMIRDERAFYAKLVRDLK
jgi:tripartite-type tricarboxylate transporter receptor subunit TctC